jgi:hypothetical protein
VAGKCNLISKLDVLQVACDKCGRKGRYAVARLIEQRGANGKGAHASHSYVHAQIKEDIMTRTFLILLALASSPAYAQSCDPVRYPGSCKDKVMQYVQCIVKAETYLCVPKIRFCNIGGAGRRGRVVM